MTVVAIWVASIAGVILYEKLMYRRAKKQGKQYYISPISFRKYHIY